MKRLLCIYNAAAGVVLPLVVGIGCYLSAASGPIDPAHPHPNPPNPSPSAITAAGHSFGVQGAAGTLADAFDAGAVQIESGAKRADVWAFVQKSWQTARMSAFDKLASPAFGPILTEDSEFTPQSRPAVAAAFRAFAIGLRGVK